MVNNRVLIRPQITALAMALWQVSQYYLQREQDNNMQSEKHGVGDGPRAGFTLSSSSYMNLGKDYNSFRL